MNMKKIAVMLMVLSLLLGCIGATAETFEGVGTGNGGDIKVAITVEDGKITAIEGNRGIGIVATREIPVGWGCIRGYAQPNYVK